MIYFISGYVKQCMDLKQSLTVSKKDEPKYLIKDEISVFLIALTRFDIDFE